MFMGKNELLIIHVLKSTTEWSYDIIHDIMVGWLVYKHVSWRGLHGQMS